mgnify:FL=1
MKDTWIKYSKLVALTALSAGFIVSPIFFLPLTTDFFSFQKQVLLLIVTAIALIAWSIHNIVTKAVRITLSPMLLPLILFSGVVITSLATNPPQTPDSWFGRGALYLILAVYYLLTTSLIKAPKTIKKIVNLFLLVTSGLALWGILSSLGAFEALGTSFLTAKTFSPAGSMLSLVGFLITTLPISLVLAFKTKASAKKMQYFLAAGLTISAIILVGFQLLPNQQLAVTLLPKLAGWSIAIDTLKSKVLFGAGPSNFINQFTRFKPISLNQTNLWAVNFATSSNEYLHLLTTLGLGGLVTFGLMITGFLKLTKHEPGTRTTALQLALKLSVLTTLVLGLFIPFTTLIWITLVSYLSLAVGLNKGKTNTSKIKDIILTISAITMVDSSQEVKVDTSTQTFPGILPWLLAVPTIIGISLVGFNVGKTYAAEIIFRNSLIAANQNLGGETYNLQIKALNTQSSIDRYRVAYSNTNFALANSLSQQGELTDQDQQTVTQLVQQAVREARVATQINPLKASNWENLANIYRQLVNFAEGSDEFAIASYTQAIQLDPANPRLRLDLGGLLFSLEKFPEAEDRFLEAVQLKPDYANAYYNLAQSYKSQEKYLEAYQALQQVGALIEPGTEDATKLQEEITQVQAMLPQAPAQTGADKTDPTTQLTKPSPLPEAPADLEPIEIEEPAVLEKEATDSAEVN